MTYRIHRPIFGAGALDALIRSLGPAAWFRPGVGITVTGSGVSQWDDQSGNGRHLLQGTDAARPIDLPFSGTRYLYLPGVAGNYASTPNAAGLDITGDATWIARMSLVDWTPSAVNAIAGKMAGGWVVFVNTTSGVLVLYDGTSNIASTAAPAIADGGYLWVKITHDVNNGAGGRETKFYTAPDSATVPTTWTQLGTTVTTATAVNLANANVPVTVGAYGAGGATSPLSGRVLRFIWQSGIDGTTVVDFDPSRASDSATSFVASTGETWTINSSGGLPSQIVGRAAILFNGTSHYLKTNAFTLAQPEWVLWVGKQVSWTNGEFICDGNAINTGVIYQSATTPRIRMFAGAPTTENENLAVGSLGVVSAVFNGASSSLQVNLTTTAGGNPGAANMGGLTLGAKADGTLLTNISTSELIVFPIAPSTALQARIIAGLMARHGVA